MKICLIPSAKLSYESGSTLYAAMVANRLTDLGHDVHVICSELPKKSVEKATFHLIDILEHPVIDDYPVSNRDLLDTMNKLEEHLFAILSEEEFDVVHAHYATFNSLAAIKVAKTLFGVPLVLSCFGRDVFNGFENDRRYRRMVEISVHGADAIVCSNESVLAKVRLLGAKCPTEILRMPVDDSQFSLSSTENRVREKYGCKEKDIVVLNIASCFAQEKGIDTAIEGFAKVSQSFNNAKLLIVGGDEHPELINEHRLRKMVKRLCLEDKVIFTGYVSHSDIPQYIAEADIFIDSRLVGNYSSVILESLSMGKAILASDAPGNREFIKHGENGLLYAHGDADALSQSLAKLIAEKELSSALSSRAKAWFAENKSFYALYDHIKHLEKIYLYVRENSAP
ncbi:glycosyltransferase family 4 protein [Paenibacillus andongensis]|uniref:glycosyltransferase family 4 protein n=1 Tax=Paenibacillus andongensis TaxID=2975482 RepID=UPI0021BAD1B1|nr:glycosyltransferase family 4 protein [Paenibacillus andongensis]